MKYISKFFIQWASVTGLLFLLAPSTAQTVHIAHCMAGCPEPNGGSAADYDEIVVRHLYAAGINSNSDLAGWVAYRVLKDSVGVASLLPRSWVEDELLSSGLELDQTEANLPRFQQADLSNQQDREYRINEINLSAEDRGRLAPMTSFAGTPYWSELNYLSNMSTLPNDLRMGSWSRLDQSVNELAARIGEVFVVSGPVYQTDEAMASLSPGNEPIAYYKIISADDRVAAYVFHQDMVQPDRYCDQLSSLSAVENLVGLSLFPQQNAPLRNDLQLEFGCTE